MGSNELNLLLGRPGKVFSTALGQIWLGDSLEKMRRMHRSTVNLCVTSPPYPLITKKKYGNVNESDYIDWFIGFAREIHRLLRPDGSFVVDLGCCWEKGKPVRSTYDMRLALRLIDELGFNLAQEIYWYNPSRLPGPAQWVTVERIRLKDSVNKILWFSKSDRPKADNKRVLKPYSERMEKMLSAELFPTEKRRPSGHLPTDSLMKRHPGAIPGNLLASPNSNSSADYLAHCRAKGFEIHPARFPIEVPEFFIRFLTEPGDKVLDPFAGSCTTGAAAESQDRRWICIEQEKKYLEGAPGYFSSSRRRSGSPEESASHVKIPRLGVYAD